MGTKLNVYEHQDVLDWVNEVRAFYGLGMALTELPCGVVSDAYCCPIARGVGGDRPKVTPGNDVERGVLTFEDNPGAFMILPGYVNDFAQAFDAGDHADLIEAA